MATKSTFEGSTPVNRQWLPADGDWSTFLQAELAKHDSLGLRRTRGSGSASGEFTDFGSNDYLGLSRHPSLLSALKQCETAGSGASPVLTGHTKHHAQLEARLAELNNSQDALVFSCGFSCHCGVIACLAGSNDLILSDQLNHASLIDGCRLSRSQVHVFPHNDVDYVGSFLLKHRHKYDKILLVTESVFSMDGDCAPLAELTSLSEQFSLGLVVDEAHALGTFGDRGSGLVEQLQLAPQPLAKLGTLSKAAGLIGGYVCGSKLLIDYLINYCRSYIYSTAPPVPIVQASLQALGLIESMAADRIRLRQTSVELRRRLRDMGWPVPAGESPVIPIVVGDAARALAISRELRNEQMIVPAIRPPTVPPETARLRLSLSTRHTAAEIEKLIHCLSRLIAD